MKVNARVESSLNRHDVTVETNDNVKTLQIAPKPTGYGSSVNGGELLLLALATCYCNDIYREAARKNIAVSGVEVACTAEFGADGEPGKNFKYQVKINSDAPTEVISELIRHTDSMAEIHNTLRKGVSVELQ